MTKKENIIKKEILLNKVFYEKMKLVKDKFTQLYPQKRMRQFDNNYWKLAYILQYKLFNEKNVHYKVSAYSKYGAEIHYNNLHTVCGFRKDVFNLLIPFFEQENAVKALRNENGGRSYSRGSQKYSSRATVYYIPLQLVMQMEECDTNMGATGELMIVETNKNNVFFNKEARKQKTADILPWVEEAKNNPYKDFKKYPTDWQMIDIMRIGDLEYDEEKFLRIAAEIGVENPVEYLRKCKESGKIGNIRLLHGRVFRYGWNHLKTELRKAIIYHGQHIVQGADFHCADFKMMAVIAWMRREDFKIKVDELERFTEAVKGDFYQSFIKWYKEKYKVELDRDVAKEGLLRFRNDTNSNKRNDERYKEIREYFEQYYPTITKGMLYSYREITVEGQVKNCISTHCQNVEGYIIHERVLPIVEELVSEPFSMCDAIWIKESDFLKAPIIEGVFDRVFSDLIFDIRNKHTSFEDVYEENNYKTIKELLVA